MANIDALTGKYFHTFDYEKRTVIWQGQVIAAFSGARSDYALVQLFEWAMGEESDIKLINLADLEDNQATFYNSSEEMQYAYNTNLKHRETVDA